MVGNHVCKFNLDLIYVVLLLSEDIDSDHVNNLSNSISSYPIEY